MPRRIWPNTIIRAPVTGTILERAVEKGEFVTTSFVGDRGAKGYVVSLADLNDLEVELDISQNDFAKLQMRAARHRHHRRLSGLEVRRLHQGDLARSEPAKGHRADQGEGGEAGRPSAAGDERQCGVSGGPEAGDGGGAAPRPVVMVPATAVRDGAVFVVLDGKRGAPRGEDRRDQQQNVRIEEGLIGGRRRDCQSARGVEGRRQGTDEGVKP